jgi:hypothetical protein
VRLPRPALIAALGALAACASDGTGPNASAPHSIDITMTVDGEPATTAWWDYPAELTATVRDRGGRVLPDAPVNWTSESPGLASVSDQGVVTFTDFHIGASVAIRARSGTATSLITIPVALGLDSLQLVPNGSIGLLPDATTRVVVLRHLSNGDIGGPYFVTWATSDPAVATLQVGGYPVTNVLEAGGAPGSARVTVTSDRRADTLLVDVERPVVDRIVMGEMGTCVITVDDDRPWCWGPALMGLFGWESELPEFDSPARPHRPTALRDLALGWHYGCAIDTAGALRCWNDDGFEDAGLPASGAPWRDAASGWAGGVFGLTCAVAANGTLWCWGDWQGATFTGGGYVATPRAVRADLSFRSVDVVTAPPTVHFCAIDTGNGVWCWGMNQTRQAGHPDPADVPALHAVLNLPPIDRVTLGSQHTCALDFQGRVWCWGSNAAGQLGRDPASVPDRNHLPELIEPLVDIVEIAAGSFHTCARNATGAVWCWGANDTGQLGQGDRLARFEPTVVPGVNAAALAASGEQSCTLVRGAGILCWGDVPEGTDRLRPRAGHPDIRTAP